jgi:hypothetical protein
VRIFFEIFSKIFRKLMGWMPTLRAILTAPCNRTPCRGNRMTAR